MTETRQLFADRFRLERELGEGLTGRVYLAEDTIRRERVAIKILHADVVRDAGGFKQMIPVLRTATQLAHPNIVRAYDFNQWNGKVFLSTEFLTGRNLREVLEDLSQRSQRMSSAETSRIIFAVAEALAYAATWTPHGGLKPENIWLLNGSQVRVSDFGLNQFLPPEKLRSGATLLGKGPYLPPEAYEDPLQFAPAGDQYALGLIWLELLTGQRGQTRMMQLAHDDTVPLLHRPVLARLLRANPAERVAEPTRLPALVAASQNVRLGSRFFDWFRRPKVKTRLAGCVAACGLAAGLIWGGAILSGQRKAARDSKEDLAVLRSEWQQWDNQRLELFQAGFADTEWRETLAREFAPGHDWEILRQVYGSDGDRRQFASRQVELSSVRQALRTRSRRAESASAAMREIKAIDRLLDQIEQIQTATVGESRLPLPAPPPQPSPIPNTVEGWGGNGDGRGMGEWGEDQGEPPSRKGVHWDHEPGRGRRSARAESFVSGMRRARRDAPYLSVPGEEIANKDDPPLPGPLLPWQGREGEFQDSSSISLLDSTGVPVPGGAEANWRKRREAVVQLFQRGRFGDASAAASALRAAARQEVAEMWNATHTNAVAARFRWETELRRFNLSYIEPAEDLAARLKAAERLEQQEHWAESASELRAVQAVFGSWADELAAVPPPDDSVWQNSLGMRFVDLGEFRASIWETRVMDFARFGQESGADHRYLWVREAKAGGPTHPVASITWMDAIRFCQWLTEQERGLGVIGQNQAYRLPTDREWSRMVGLPKEPGDWAEDRALLNWDHFPWGTEPRRIAASGNYDTWPNATKENNFAPAGPDYPMDPFYGTAPAGRFPPNAAGIYDLGGNVWEFISDRVKVVQSNPEEKLIRGGGWRTVSLERMRSTCRLVVMLNNEDIGFRCVLAPNKTE